MESGVKGDGGGRKQREGGSGVGRLGGAKDRTERK